MLRQCVSHLAKTLEVFEERSFWRGGASSRWIRRKSSRTQSHVSLLTFAQAFKSHRISLRYTNMESHNILCEGETYHETIRKSFLNLRMEIPMTPRYLLLQLAFYAVNNSVESHGLVQCSQCSECFHKYLHSMAQLRFPKTSECKSFLASAREGYAKLIAKNRIGLGLGRCSFRGG